jgi:carbon storage regulator
VLVVTRQRNEGIMIGDGIEVRVVRVGKGEVRLGVIAPPDVPVHRREVYDEIRRENQTANALLAKPRRREGVTS